MTVSSTLNRATLVGNGVSTDVAIAFPFHQDSDLVVLLVVIATGVQTVKSITTHYTISGSQDAQGHYPNGGTVTMLTAPAVGEYVVVYRDPDRTQQLDLQDLSIFPAESLEAQLDALTMQIQRLADLVNRSLRQPDGDSVSLLELPAKALRALRPFGFDADGHPTVLEALDPSVAITVGSWTPEIQSVLTDDLDIDYTSQVGHFVKIGRMVLVTAELFWDDLQYTTAAGGVRVASSTPGVLPPCWASTGRWFGTAAMTGFDGTTITKLDCMIQPNTDYFIFPATKISVGAGLWIPLVATELLESNGTLLFSCMYDAGA